MNKAMLNGADLRDANLQEVKMNLAVLRDANLEGANLTNEAQESWVANPTLQLPLEYSKTGRQYLLGLRYKF